MTDPGKRFPRKEQTLFQMKLESFVVDDLIKTTTFENNFKYLMGKRKIKKVFPEKSFHGKDETFQYEDGKALFREAMELRQEDMEQGPERKKQEISPGYSLNRLKRKQSAENAGEEPSKFQKRRKLNGK